MRKFVKVLSRFLGDIPRHWEVPKDGPAMIDIRQKNMVDVLNILSTRPSHERARFGQRALPRFLRRSDRSGLRNPNR
mgnify:CR=1 FL=1